ncbi:MAG: TolC family protein [Bacteroidales bacterium]|nr:TolC family protein [Bacteroidales bacterium]
MKKTLLYITTVLLSFSGFAQEKLDVDQAVALALENNHGIIMAKNTADISANNATVGNAGLLPRLDFNTGINYNNNTLQIPAGEENQESTMTNAGLNLSYTLFDGMASYYTYDKLKVIQDGGALQARYNIENTVSQVISVYYQLAEINESNKLSREMLDISSDRLQRAVEQKKYGKATSLEVLNAQVDYNNDSINYINSSMMLEEVKRSLNVMLGREPSFAFEIEAAVVDFSVFNLQQIKEEAIRSNTSYLLSQNNIETSEIDLKLAKSSYSPRLSLNSSYGYNQTVSGLDVAFNEPNTGFSTGITLSYSLFDGNRKLIQKQNALISLDNARLKEDQQQLELTKAVENAFANYQNSLAVLEAEQFNLQSAQMNFEVSKEYFQLGQITSTRFREAQLNLQRAKNNISSAKYAAKINETEIVKLSGNLIQ